MAQDPKNYRDPKVTTQPRSGGDAMRWVWIAAAIIIVLLLLAWVFGWFGRDAAVDTTTTTPGIQTLPGPQSSVPPEGTTVGPLEADEGNAPATDLGAPPATGPLDEGSAAPDDETGPLPPQTEDVTPLPAPAD